MTLGVNNVITLSVNNAMTSSVQKVVTHNSHINTNPVPTHRSWQGAGYFGQGREIFRGRDKLVIRLKVCPRPPHRVLGQADVCCFDNPPQ